MLSNDWNREGQYIVCFSITCVMTIAVSFTAFIFSVGIHVYGAQKKETVPQSLRLQLFLIKINNNIFIII